MKSDNCRPVNLTSQRFLYFLSVKCVTDFLFSSCDISRCVWCRKTGLVGDKKRFSDTRVRLLEAGHSFFKIAYCTRPLEKSIGFSKYNATTIEYVQVKGLLTTYESISNTFLFPYIQLRLAVVAQFGLKDVSLQPSKLRALLIEDDHSKLVSRYYLVLRSSSSIKMERISRQWQADIPSWIEEMWTDIAETQISKGHIN